ncbi:MAG: hypothetical protein JWN64_84 [Parcubacteria group bacterium]|nr:hypothetical protein [Parcubacteria group bacterium]
MKEKNGTSLKNPGFVKDRLSREVHTILRVCLHQFDDVEKVAQESCFDVDAVMQHRSVASRPVFEKNVAAAQWSKPAVIAGSHRPLTRPQKGYFIPSGYASNRGFA